MTRKIAGTCFAALFGFALTAAAQQPPTAPPTAPPTDPQQPPAVSAPMTQSERSSGKEKKLTGCVQSGTEAGSFELTNIKGKGADSAEHKSVKLVAAPGTDLATHVGHTVEVSGTWSAGSSMSSPSSTSPSSTTPPSTSPSQTSPSASGSSDKGEFNVTNVKMVSATCSTGTN